MFEEQMQQRLGATSIHNCCIKRDNPNLELTKLKCFMFRSVEQIGPEICNLFSMLGFEKLLKSSLGKNPNMFISHHVLTIDCDK